MRTAIDSNVLLDILTGDPRYAALSRHAIDTSVAVGSLSICPVVYAELATRFVQNPGDLDVFLSDLGIALDAFGPDALKAGAAAWRIYTQSRGQQSQCPQCGRPFTVNCPSCGQPIGWRQHILPDFLVGGYALTQADRLLTRDRRIYPAYFPTLDLIKP